MISNIIQAVFFIKIEPNMNEQENKPQRIYELINPETKPTFFSCTQNNFFVTKKELFKEKGKWRIGQQTKIRVFNCSR